MATATYETRRGQLETYFDRTAFDAWSRLTSNEPVGRIRATVRAGRDSMRNTLLEWLPDDLHGRTLLDAGCGTGALAIEAARRGAHVVAVDISPSLIEIAQKRTPGHLGGGSVEFRVGDMLSPSLGDFDHVVAMDSLIHYNTADVVEVLSVLSARTRNSIHFTFAPRTLPLAVMHVAGRLFPRHNRAPSVEPVRENALRRSLREAAPLQAWEQGRSERVDSGFYISQALELKRQ